LTGPDAGLRVLTALVVARAIVADSVTGQNRVLSKNHATVNLVIEGHSELGPDALTPEGEAVLATRPAVPVAMKTAMIVANLEPMSRRERTVEESMRASLTSTDRRLDDLSVKRFRVPH
jgi:hypothetical protein